MRLVIALFAALLIIAAGCTSPGQPQQAGGQEAPAGTAPSGGAASGGQGTPSGGSSGSSSGGSSGMSEAECLTNCNVLTDSDMVDLCKAGCYTESAETSLDSTKCDPINQMANMSVFYNTCLGTVAGKMKSTAPCERLSDLNDRDWCILISAEDNKDPSICDKVNNSIYKGVCIDDTTPDS